MVLGEEMIQALRFFGLTGCQAKVYLSIVQLGLCTAGQISRLSKVRREQVYRTLPKLERMGLVEKTIGTPIRVMAIPVDDALNMLVMSEERARIRKVAQLKHKKGEIIEKLRARARRTKTEEENPQFSLVSERAALLSKYSSFLKNAKKEISFITSRMKVARFTVLYADLLKESVAKGVKIRIITEMPEEEDRIPRILEEQLSPGDSVQLRCTEKLYVHFGIVDDREMLMTASVVTPLAETPTLWTTSVPLIESFRRIFEDLWRTSLSWEDMKLGTTSDMVTRFIRHLEPRDHAILIYENTESKYNVLFNYIQCGLEKGEAAVYVCSEATPKQIRTAMKLFGIDVDKYEKTGALKILYYTEHYIIHGHFSESRTLQFWEKYRKEAMNRGFNGIRVTGEMACFFEHNLVQDLIEYEKAYREKEAHRDHFPMTAICAYNANILNHGGDLMGVYSELIRVHKEILFSGWDQKLGVLEIRKTTMQTKPQLKP